MTLGITDWGTAGLGLYNLVKQARPDISVMYLADNSSTEHSLLSRQELEEKVRQILATFRRLGVDHVVFTGNAASTSLPDVAVNGVKAMGVVEPTLRAMRSKRYREVGVIGGRRTILSGAYGRSLRKLRFCVLQRMSLELSSAIENGSASEAQIHQILTALVEPLIKSDAIVIASSPYRKVTPILQRILPAVDVIDPTQEAVIEILKWLPPAASGVPSDTFYCTGDPLRFRERASSLFGLNIHAQLLKLGSAELAA